MLILIVLCDLDKKLREIHNQLLQLLDHDEGLQGLKISIFVFDYLRVDFYSTLGYSTFVDMRSDFLWL
jgi:hypothetical protein